MSKEDKIKISERNIAKIEPFIILIEFFLNSLSSVMMFGFIIF